MSLKVKVSGQRVIEESKTCFLILMSCDVIVHGCMYRHNYMLTTKCTLCLQDLDRLCYALGRQLTITHTVYVTSNITAAPQTPHK